jgi:glutamate dehydrogenase
MSSDLKIGPVLQRYSTGIRAVRGALPGCLSDGERRVFEKAREDYMRIDVPAPTAENMAALGPLPCAFDVVDIAGEFQMDVRATAELYFRVGGLAGADWLREQVEQLEIRGRWQAIARQSLRDNVYALQGELVRHVARQCDAPSLPCATVLTAWATTSEAGLQRVEQVISEIGESGKPDFESLTVVAQEIRKLARSKAPA